MGFPFWKKDRNSAPNASELDAASKTSSSASSSPNTEAGPSEELQAEINEALKDVRVAGAEAMQATIYDILKEVMQQVAGVTTHLRGGKVMEVFSSKKANDHIIVAFADGTAISVKVEASTVLELDAAEGRR